MLNKILYTLSQMKVFSVFLMVVILTMEYWIAIYNCIKTSYKKIVIRKCQNDCDGAIFIHWFEIYREQTFQVPIEEGGNGSILTVFTLHTNYY